mgnify:CR=1 FL=1
MNLIKIINRRYIHVLNNNIRKIKTTEIKTTEIKTDIEISDEIKEWLKEDIPRSTEESSLPTPWTDEYKDITNTNY